MDGSILRERNESGFSDIVDFLKELVSIPSVSSLPEHHEDMERSAQFVLERFQEVGVEARVVKVKDPVTGLTSQPAILGEKKGPQGAPTVLLYAHHDVQPAGDPAKWDTPPFTATEKDGRLYGRGTSDDGAGVAVHLAALRSWGSDLPVTVRVFIEGEEEIGSPTFEAFLTQHADFMNADVIVVVDSSNWEVHQPAITTGLRGVVTADVKVRVSSHAVHSGAFGGPLLDAPTVLCRLIAALHDEDGAVAVPGLLSCEHADVQYSEADFRSQVGAVEGLQLAGRGDLASRLWFQPAISVIGFDTTSVRESSNTINPEAAARLSMRIAPGQDPQDAAEKLVSFLKEKVSFCADLSVTVSEMGPAYSADMQAPALHLMQESLSEAFGVRAVNIGIGGSIPFIATFQEMFPHAQILVTGVEDPYTQAHSENESQDLSDLRDAALAEALFFARLAQQS